MALDNEERSQQNALLKRHGYRWVKDNSQWILKDPKGKTTTPEKAIQTLTKKANTAAVVVRAAVEVTTPVAPTPVIPKLPIYTGDQPAIMRWAQQVIRRRPLILDIKTTNLAGNDEIIQIAMVDIQGHIVFDSLIKPGQPVASMSVLAQAPTFSDIWSQIYPLLIHNELISYDAACHLRLVRQTVSQNQLALPAIVSHSLMAKYAMYAGEKVSEREYKIHSLSQACAAFGITTDTQQAIDAAEATRYLLLAMAQQNV